MAAKSVLLKLSAESHAQVMQASERHQRSMQKLLVALIEDWLDQGAPDPVELASEPGVQAHEPAASRPVDAVDQRSRQAIDLLAQHMLQLQSSLQELQKWREMADRGTSHSERYWEHFSEAMDSLVRQGIDISVSPLQLLINKTWDELSNGDDLSNQKDPLLMEKRLAQLIDKV